jgi:hypothetical protein
MGNGRFNKFLRELKEFLLIIDYLIKLKKLDLVKYKLIIVTLIIVIIITNKIIIE